MQYINYHGCFDFADDGCFDFGFKKLASMCSKQPGKINGAANKESA